MWCWVRFVGCPLIKRMSSYVIRHFLFLGLPIRPIRSQDTAWPPFSACSARSFSPLHLQAFLPRWRLTYLMFTVRRKLFVPLLGTTPKGLTNQGFSPSGNIVIAFSVTISATAVVTNLRCSDAEEEFSISFRRGASTAHQRQ